jgi:hypothetical protein
MGSSGLTDPDTVPEVPDQPITRLGDVWLLGEHRVGCGDSTSATDVAQVLSTLPTASLPLPSLRRPRHDGS